MRFMSTLWWVFTQNTWFCFFLASVRVLQRTSISTNIKVRCNTECYFVKFFVSISGTFGVQGWSIALNGFVSAAETNFFVYTELTWIQVTDLRDLIQRGWVSIMASLVNGVEISWLQLYLFTFCRSDSTFPVLCLDQMEAWLPMPHTSQFISVPCRKLCNIRFKQHYFQLNTT